MPALQKTGTPKNIINYILGIHDAYEIDIKRYASFIKSHKYTFSIDSFKEYTDYLIREGYSAKTINKNVAALRKRVRMLFGFVNNTNKLFKMEHELKKIKYIKITTDKIPGDKILSPEDIEKLIENTEPDTALFIRFLYHTGLRVSEMLSIKLKKVLNKKKYYEIRVLGKGLKERIIKCNKQLVNDIKSYFSGKTYLFEKDGKQYTRFRISHKIQDASRDILGKNASAHTLRHCFATHKLQETKNTKGVSSYLGHSSTSTTLNMYVHSELSLDDLGID